MKLTRRAKTIITLLSFAAVASAQFSVPQNARMNSMANTFVIDDITDVYRYPVLMNDYYGHLQATFNTPIVGIKNINDMFSIGATATSGNMLRSFYGPARTTLANLDGNLNADIFQNQINIPHILLGFDLGTVQLGADVFFEYSRYSSKSESTPDGESTTETTVSGALTNPGLVFSGKIDVGFPVMAKFGMGFPSIGGESKTGSTVNTEIKSEKGLYMEMGAEAKPSMMGLDWTAGFGYTSESYQFQEDESIGVPYNNSVLDGYLGFEYDVLETAVSALQYHIMRTGNRSGEDDAYTLDEQWSHQFSAAVENTWVKPWKLDAFQLRAGMDYNINMDVTKAHTEAAGTTNESVTKNPANDNGFVPTMGFGFGKGFFQLDMNIGMGSWSNGLFSGPDVGSVTATMKF
ncbi:MAG: hypothetical protein ACLFVE_12950 [Chitinispirillaceae bacterium]